MRYDRIEPWFGKTGDLDRATPTQTQTGGLEIRLLRWLPVESARLRRRACWRWPARSRSPIFPKRRGHGEGPYDLSLVEGSITTPHDAARIQQVRRVSKVSGDHWGLCHGRRNPGPAQLSGRARVLAHRLCHPAYIDTLDTSTPIADHVRVDFELRGCPINKQQLLEVISAFLHGRKPNTPPTASASNASDAARSASWWRTARLVSGR